MKIGKEIKVALFADNMIIYIENPRKSTKITEFSKVVRYKVNI